MKNKPKAGDIVKLPEPQWVKITGQGGPPPGMWIRRNGQSIYCYWGTIFEVKDMKKIADFDASGSYPFLQTDFAGEIQHQLKLIKGN